MQGALGALHCTAKADSRRRETRPTGSSCSEPASPVMSQPVATHLATSIDWPGSLPSSGAARTVAMPTLYAALASFFNASSRSARRRIFPTLVLGKLVLNSTYLGILYAVIFLRQ